SGPTGGTTQSYGLIFFNDPGTTAARSASPLDVVVAGNQITGTPGCFVPFGTNGGDVAPALTAVAVDGAPPPPVNGVEIANNAGVVGVGPVSAALGCAAVPAPLPLGRHAVRTAAGQVTVRGRTQRTATVTFAAPEPDAQYVVGIMPAAQVGLSTQAATRVRGVTKTTAGFTVALEAAPGTFNSSVTFDWVVMR